MTDPRYPNSFDYLIKKTTLEIIYLKFQAAAFSTEDVVTRVYWLGSVERHVQYMVGKGWIVLGDDKKYRFVVGPEKWVYGGEVH